jgi:hypothetical protein
MLPMLIILPRLRVAIDWPAIFESRNTAFSWVTITLSQSKCGLERSTIGLVR